MYDYDTLTGAKSVEGSIRWWGNHTKIPATQVLYEAEAYIYSQIRVRQMRAAETLALLTGDSGIPFPSDYQALIELKIFGDANPLPFVHENLLNRFRDDNGVLTEGRPNRFADIANEISFDCRADADYNMRLWYYATPASLSTLNPTNWLTIGYPTLLRYVCTAFAFQDRKRHSEALDYFKLAQIEIDNANSGDDLARNTQILR